MTRDSFPFDEIDVFFNNLRRKWQDNTSQQWNQMQLDSSFSRDFPSRLTERRLDGLRPSLEWRNETSRNETSTSTSTSGSGLTESTNKGKYEVDIPLQNGIGPEDLKVTLKDHVMTIEAKKESKSDDGTRKTFLEFKRQFTIPPNVNMSEVKSVLTSEGHLKIEAPIPPPPKPQQAAITSSAPFRDTPIPIRAE